MARSIVSDLHKIFKSSVSAVLPENLIKRSVKYNPVNQQLSIAGEDYNLENKNVYLIGAGKAVQNMAREIYSLMTTKIKHGLISIPVGSTNCNTIQNNIYYCEGAMNNLPDESAETTAIKIRDLVTSLSCDDLLIVLISGGGSALLPLPKPPITLAEKTELIKSLAHSGADIKELNTVRKVLSDLKGGQLAIKAQPAQVVSLILSDIVGDPLDLIASGPTTANEDDALKPTAIINKYKLLDHIPESIKTVLNQSNNENNFPKSVKNYIIGSNEISIAAALEEARSLDYYTLGLSSMVTGNVKEVATEYAKLTKLFCSFLGSHLNLEELKVKLQSCLIPGINTDLLEGIDIQSLKNKDLCLVLGGEITVEVKGSGMGGRNQQLALEYSYLISQEDITFNNFDIYFLSAGTDGIDGPTDAAGAIGCIDLVSEANKENLDVKKYLEENDSYNFYKQFRNGSLHVITGHTNTNVMDVHIIILRRKK